MLSLTQVIDTIACGKIKLVYKDIKYSTRFEFEDNSIGDRIKYNIIPIQYIDGIWIDVPNGQNFIEDIILNGDYKLVGDDYK